MEYINHIGKYTDSQAVADALEAGTLASPYVVQIDGSIYYDNYPEPEPEPEVSTMGSWSDDGEGNYTFQITETDTTYWGAQVKIGELLGVYSDGNYGDLDVQLDYDGGSDTWHLVFYAEEASNNPEYNFEEGVPYAWESGAMTDSDDSDAVITVDWDGTDTFMFQSGDLHPISMTTIDPPYPSEEEPGE